MEEPAASPEVVENSISTDVKTARLVMNNLAETLHNLKSDALSILSLFEQWKTVQSSFAVAEERRAKELESKERGIESKERDLRDIEAKVGDLLSVLKARQEELKVKEMSVVEREKSVDECCRELEIVKGEVDERWREVKLREKEVIEGIEEREKGIRDERGRIEVEWRELEERKREVGEKCSALEVREKEIVVKELILKEREKELRVEGSVLELLRKGIDVECRELEERKREIGVVLGGREKEMEERKRGLNSREMELDERWREMELRGKEVREAFEEKCRKFEAAWKEREEVLEARERLIDDCRKWGELTEKEVVDRDTKLDEKEKVVEERCRGLEEREKGIDHRCRELDSREKEMEGFRDVLVAREKEMNERCRELEDRERGLNDRCKELDSRTERLSVIRGNLEFKKKEMRESERARCEELRLKEDQLMKIGRAVKVKERKIGELCKEVTETQERINEKSNALDEMKKEITDCFEMVESDVSLDAVNLNAEQASEDLDVVTLCSSSDIHFSFRNMNAEVVKSYLFDQLDNVICHETMLNYLQLAPDPAKLVLEVIRSLYNIAGVESKAVLSCLYLLVLLMELQPHISQHVYEEAREFATTWRGSLAKQGDALLEIFCFSQFLAAYKLVGRYDVEELRSLFRTFYDGSEVYQPDQNLKLCHALGLSKKSPGLVQFLMKRGKHLEAVKHMCVFKMKDVFSPESLLEAHWKSIQTRVAEMMKGPRNIAQDDAANMELGALRAMIQFISDFKLESSYSTAPLKLRISQLEKEMKERPGLAKSLTLKKCQSALSETINSDFIFDSQIDSLCSTCTELEVPFRNVLDKEASAGLNPYHLSSAVG